MNNVIKELNQKLADATSNAYDIENQLQCAWNEVFKDMTILKDAVTRLESSNEYTFDKYGEIASWIRFYELQNFDDCRQYLVEFMRDYYFVEIDFDNDALFMSQGDDNYIIQDDTRHDNGVWLNGKLIIDESEYKVDGDIDEVKRNELIESHMEKTGCYPGVFRCDSYNNVFLVDTQNKK